MIFFQKISTSLSRALSRGLSNVGAYDTIELTDGLRLHVPKPEVVLENKVGGSEIIQSMKLSIKEAVQIFESVQRAYDRCEIVEVRVGRLLWTTDARSRLKSDEVIIKYNGPLGVGRLIARREDVARALAEFAHRFESNK